MSVSTFRAALDAIVRLFRADAARAAQAVSSVSTAGMSEAERVAVLDAAGRAYRSYLADAVTIGRHRAWAAALSTWRSRLAPRRAPPRSSRRSPATTRPWCATRSAPLAVLSSRPRLSRGLLRP